MTEATKDERVMYLRMPADIHDEIRSWADEDERSMTRTVLMIVRRALLQRKQRNYIPGPDGLLSEVTK